MIMPFGLPKNLVSDCLRIAATLVVLLALAVQPVRLASAAPTAGASPAITIRVNTATDGNVSNATMSLREAILLVNGGTGGDGLRTGLHRALTAGEANLISGGSFGTAGQAAKIVFTDLPALPNILITIGTGSPWGESLPPVLTSGVVIDGASATGTSVTLDGSGAPASTDLLWLGWTDSASTPSSIAVSGVTVQNLKLTGAKRYGIHLDPASSSLITGCTVTASTSYAIYINGKFGAATNNVVDNVIVGGNNSLGIVVNRPGSAFTTIRNSFIGTNATGTAAALNNGAGIALFTGTHDNAITGNVISGNYNQGIYLAGKLDGSTILSVDHITVFDNKIGVAADGVTPLPNGQGIVFDIFASNNTIGGILPGQANIIAGNTESGVVVAGGASGNTTNGNHISGNAIFKNGVLGIDLLDDKVPTVGVSGGSALGPNKLALRPTLTKAQVRQNLALFTGTASPNSTIEFFVADTNLAGLGSGKAYCATVTANAAGDFRYYGTITCTPGGAAITATSTLSDGSTSEFGLDLVTGALPTVFLPGVMK